MKEKLGNQALLFSTQAVQFLMTEDEKAGNEAHI